MQPSDLLVQLGLQEYAIAFEDNAIDADSLASLTDSDLKELGVTKLGHRKKILDAITGALPVSIEGPAEWHEAVSRLPNIVALPLREYAGEEHPVARLWAMCDTVELLLRLMVTVFVSHRRDCGGLSEKTADSLASLVESPTLGAWFVMTQTLAKEADPSLREATKFVQRPLKDLLYGPDKPGTPETSLLRLRNRLAHGGGLTKREAARLLQIWRDRFELVLRAMKWLHGWELFGRDEGGSWLLLTGHEPSATAFSPLDHFQGMDAVWIKIGERKFPLWPLAAFGRAKTAGGSKHGTELMTQIYTRRESVNLAYTPVGAEGIAHSESDASGLEAFKSLFRLDRPKNAVFQVADFDKEIRNDAAQAVGRAKEANAVVEAIEGQTQGVVWIGGAAGMGKSFLIAKVVAQCFDRETGDQDIMLAYRFRSSDQLRCSRESLATFLEERLVAAGAVALSTSNKNDSPAQRLDNLFSQIKTDKRIIIFLDGLDEVTGRDAKFASEIPIALNYPNLLWVCSGRPEGGLDEAMHSMGARILFDRGLPPMNADDIRGMVLEKIGPLRKKLLAGDKERGELVVNPFIDLVTVRAAGLPLYVKYVVGDVLAGKYRVLDGQEDLPDSLQAYHEELLRRLAVGDLQAIVTPLVAMLACAHEPLSSAELATILANRNLIKRQGSSELIDKALAAVSSMIVAAPDPDGEAGFMLFHSSLRDHIRTSPLMVQSVAMASDAFADLAALHAAPPEITSYLLRCGVRHLLDAERRDDARKLLLDLDRFNSMREAGVTSAELLRYWNQIGGELQALAYTAPVDQMLRSALPEDHSIWEMPYEDLILPAAAKLELKRLERLRSPSGEAYEDVADDRRADYIAGLQTVERELIDGDPSSYGAERVHMWRRIGQLRTLMSWAAEAGWFDLLQAISSKIVLASTHALGLSHVQTLGALREHALLEKKLGHVVSAEGILMLCQHCYETSLGPENADTLLIIHDLACLKLDQGQLADARQFLERAKSGFAKSLGPLDLNTLAATMNLALVDQQEGNLQDAETAMREVLAAYEKIVGKADSSMLNCICALAGILRQRGKLTDAEQLLSGALSKTREQYGYAHWLTLQILHNLADVHGWKGDLVASRNLLQEHFADSDQGAVEGHHMREINRCRNLFGPEHELTLDGCDRYALFLTRTGRPKDAVEFLEEHVTGIEGVSFNYLYNLACYQCVAGQLQEAQFTMESVLLDNPQVIDSALRDPDMEGIRDFFLLFVKK